MWWWVISLFVHDVTGTKRPFKIAFARVYELCMGCEWIDRAREAMLSVGSIQRGLVPAVNPFRTEVQPGEFTLGEIFGSEKMSYRPPRLEID